MTTELYDREAEVLSAAVSRRSERHTTRETLGTVLRIAILAVAKLKYLTVIGSMALSVVTYSLLWGWTFALGFVIVLFIHEMGHVLELKRSRIPASVPVFIPFLGAAVAMRGRPKNAAVEARVGLAGPITGTASALVVLGVYALTGSPFWRALAFVAFFLQLFNLIPMLPLDGGRAMAAISTRIWFVGWLGMIGLAIYTGHPLIFVVVALGAMELVTRWGRRKNPETIAYHSVRVRDRLIIGAVYLVLVLSTGYATVALG